MSCSNLALECFLGLSSAFPGIQCPCHVLTSLISVPATSLGHERPDPLRSPLHSTHYSTLLTSLSLSLSLLSLLLLFLLFILLQLALEGGDWQPLRPCQCQTPIPLLLLHPLLSPYLPPSFFLLPFLLSLVPSLRNGSLRSGCEQSGQCIISRLH